MLSPSIVLMPRALMITLSLCSSAGWYYIYVFSKGISNIDYPENSVLLCLHEYSNIYVFCLCFFFSFGVLSFKLDLWLRQQTVVTDTGFHKCSGAHSVISTTVPSPFQYSIVCVYCIQIYREKDTHTYKSTNTQRTPNYQNSSEKTHLRQMHRSLK